MREIFLPRRRLTPLDPAWAATILKFLVWTHLYWSLYYIIFKAHLSLKQEKLFPVKKSKKSSESLQSWTLLKLFSWPNIVLNAFFYTHGKILPWRWSWQDIFERCDKKNLFNNSGTERCKKKHGIIQTQADATPR